MNCFYKNEEDPVKKSDQNNDWRIINETKHRVAQGNIG